MLSALLNFGDPVRPRPMRIAPQDSIEGDGLFEALTCEFHWTSLQIGAIASCMNASVAARRAWMLRACGNLIPVESPIVKVALRAWQDIGLPRELAAMIARLYLELADAKKLTLPLVTNAGVFVAPKVPLAKLEQIAAVWRKLAEDSRDAVLDLEPEARWRLNGVFTGNALVLSKFLKEVGSGSRACVNQQGEVALPLLPQRRKLPRYALAQSCKIFFNDSISTGITRDISKIGLTFSCDRDFALKDEVTAVLRNGRKIPGIIVWSKSGKTCLRFQASLKDDDPLISG